MRNLARFIVLCLIFSVTGCQNLNRIVLIYDDNLIVVECYTLTDKDEHVEVPESTPERPVRVFYVPRHDWVGTFRALGITPAECEEFGR